MMRGLVLAVTAAGWAAVSPGLARAQAASGRTEIVSVSTAGAQGDNDSDLPALSADGRYVAFASSAANLVPGDTNGVMDIFVHDRQTGLTERVSVSSRGREGDRDSGLFSLMGGPSLSADGRFVAFSSEATNLVSGDRNNNPDVFVHDRLTGVTERVSVTSDGREAGAGGVEAAISGDGRFVAFISFSDDLVPSDTNFADDVFVHDRVTGTTERVSEGPGGVEADSSSFRARLSADGRYVVFTSFAGNLVPGDGDSSTDVFLRDRQTGVLEGISTRSPSDSFGHSGSEAITPDGRFVAFSSQDPQLVPVDTNGFHDDVFVFDRQTSTMTLVSVNSAGAQGSDRSTQPALSHDAQRVAFTSFAPDLVTDDGNFFDDVFLRDRPASTTTRVSVSTDGGDPDLDSLAPAISGDGLVIAFASRASNLVPGHADPGFFTRDIYVRDARPAADLSVTLDDAPDPVAVRGTLTYTVAATNAGPAAAPETTVELQLPADSAFLSAAAGQGSCVREGKGRTNGHVVCALGMLAAGSSTTVTVSVSALRAGTLSATATVRSSAPDSDPANNRATADTTVLAR